MMEKFNHIYIVGCSYMNSYVAASPHQNLKKFFGGEVSDITYAGTGYDYHERELIHAVLEDNPEHALIIFGLSYWHRFELPYRYDNRIKRMHFNPSAVMHDHDFEKYYPDLKNLPNDLLNHRVYNSESYIENIFQRLITLTGWLKSQSHKYIIFNQIDDNYIKFLNKNTMYKNYFNKDSGYIKLHEFLMLDWLKSNGVDFDDNNHPSTLPITGDIWTKFFIDYYENNLK